MSIQLPSFPLPDLAALTAGLTSVFCGDNLTDYQVTVIERKPAIHISTHYSEIVMCRLENGAQLQVLCKYGGHSDDVYDVRLGVKYEAQVYRQLLRPLQISTAKFYGAYKDVTTGKVWLILEYLDEFQRVIETVQPTTAMCLAARWLGRFHAANQARISVDSMAFLTTYDSGYYIEWANRASFIVGHLHKIFPWLATLCTKWKEVAGELLLPTETVIHGEFYPKNVLIHNETVCPVDWESTAISVGEIDLAALTENWSEEIIQQCIIEYQLVRWPEGAPVNFPKRFDAAQLYLLFRYLGEQTRLITHEYKKHLWLFEKLRSIGERLELI